MTENRFDLTVIGNLRKKRGLTADELASQARLTRSTVAKIESGKANPTLGTVQAIADALGMGVTELLALAEVHRQAVGDTTPFEIEGMRGFRVTLPGLEVFHLEVEPAARASFDPRFHENTMETCLVLSGDLELTVGGKLHHLGSGRAVSFRALQAHELHSPGGCALIMIHYNTV